MGSKCNHIHISCHVSKYRMLQSSAIVATTKGEQVSPEGTQDVKTQDTGPRQLKVKKSLSRV